MKSSVCLMTSYPTQSENLMLRTTLASTSEASGLDVTRGVPLVPKEPSLEDIVTAAREHQQLCGTVEVFQPNSERNLPSVLRCEGEVFSLEVLDEGLCRLPTTHGV